MYPAQPIIKRHQLKDLALPITFKNPPKYFKIRKVDCGDLQCIVDGSIPEAIQGEIDLVKRLNAP